MKDTRVKKCLVVGIILLFVGTCIIPAIAQTIEKPSVVSNGHILYVGGSGPGNYTRIQDAVNNSSNGDIVYVYDDSSPYFEHVSIPKSITLFGENKETTIIDGNGSGSVVLLNRFSSFVTIQGFNITHGRDGIFIESSNNTIIGNIVSNNTNGVSIQHRDNTIVDNVIHKNADGVVIEGDYNTILGNTITESNHSGIVVGGLHYNIIKNNIIQHNSGIGIYLFELSDYNTISGNIITNNTNTGIILFISDKNIIEGNNIEVLDLFNCGGNIIRKNNFIGHRRHVYCTWAFSNKWDANYWDNWIGVRLSAPVFQKLPKILLCGLLPHFNFD
jgi:parallel beta-helix repeat protein